MGTALSTSIGYRGIVRIGGVSVVADSGSYSVKRNSIVSQGVWGYNGLSNDKASKYWTDDHGEVTGSIGASLTYENYDAVLKVLFGRGMAEVLIVPDGSHGLKMACFGTSRSVTCSQDQNASSSVSYMGHLGGVNSNEAKNPDSSVGGGLPSMTLMPYYSCTLALDSSGDAVISAEVSEDLSTELIRTLDGNFYAGLGSSVATVTCDWLGSADVPRSIFSGMSFSQGTLTMGTAGKQKTIKLFDVVFDSNGSQIQTGSGWVVRSYSGEAKGGIAW